MGTGTYIGGHSKVFISDTSTRWEVSDRAAKEPDGSQRRRWDDEVAGASDGRPGRINKEARSFLSMCAAAFRSDALTQRHPEPPTGMRKQVSRAGGNKSWIASDPTRLRLFADFYYKKAKPRSLKF
jgi:hypothetical protein